MGSQKILVVKNESIIAIEIQNSLQNLGYTVLEITDSGEEAIKKVAQKDPDLVLMDICLAGKMNGVHAANIIQNNFQIPVLYLINSLEDIILAGAKFTEPFSYILKPFAERNLHIAIEIAIYKHQTEKAWQDEKQWQTMIMKSIGCGLVVTDGNGCVKMMNPAAQTLTGWKQEEALGKDLVEVVNLVNQDTKEAIANLAKQVIETGMVLNLPENCKLIAKDGKEILIGDSVAPIHDDNGSITGTVLMVQDITQRKQAEKRLVRNAFYDALTALPNRVLFLDRLRQAIEHGKRRSDYRFAVLFLDLDGFKEINDSFGHSIGDDFLVAIARRLESCLRIGDIVARFGGDEFAILLDDIQEVTDATHIANRIQECLQLPFNLSGYEILATASIGIALNENENEEPESLLQNADIAMYRAKDVGKASYVVFDREAGLFHSISNRICQDVRREKL